MNWQAVFLSAVWATSMEMEKSEENRMSEINTDTTDYNTLSLKHWVSLSVAIQLWYHESSQCINEKSEEKKKCAVMYTQP